MTGWGEHDYPIMAGALRGVAKVVVVAGKDE